MLKKLLLLFVLINTFLGLKSQPIAFEKYYGDTAFMNGDLGKKVRQLPDSGYVIAGDSKEFSDFFALIIRTDKYGDTLWTKYIDSTRVSSLEITNDTNIILALHHNFPVTSNYHPVLIKLSLNGNIIWRTEIDTLGNKLYINSISKTHDSGFICVATFPSDTSINQAKIFPFKISGNGNLEWIKVYEFPTTVYPGGVIESIDSCFFICGILTVSLTLLNRYDFFVFKTNFTGDSIFSKSYDVMEYDYIYDIAGASDGSLYLCGSSADTSGFNHFALLTKLNLNGDTIWSKLFHNWGNIYLAEFSAIKINASGNLVVSGISSVSSGLYYDMFLGVIDTSGIMLMGNDFGDYNDCNYCYDSDKTSDGGYVVIGHAHSNNQCEYGDFYFVKTDSNLLTTTGFSELQYLDFNIIPNPTQGLLKIALRNVGSAIIIITNHLGQIIFHKETKAREVSLNLSEYSNGIYHISVIANGRLISKKIALVK